MENHLIIDNYHFIKHHSPRTIIPNIMEYQLTLKTPKFYIIHKETVFFTLLKVDSIA